MEFVLTHPDSGLKQILVIFDGVPYEADSTHLWWDEIVQLCLKDDERVLDLFPPRTVQTASVEIPIEEADPPVEAEPRWLPTDVLPIDEREQEARDKAAEEAGEGGQDDEEEARAESREAEYTAHEIIEEGF